VARPASVILIATLEAAAPASPPPPEAEAEPGAPRGAADGLWLDVVSSTGSGLGDRVGETHRFVLAGRLGVGSTETELDDCFSDRATFILPPAAAGPAVPISVEAAGR
jgi:hypothetical protein